MKLAVYINAPTSSDDGPRREYPAFASSALAHGIGELATRLYDMGYSKIVLHMGPETRAYVFDGPTVPTAQELGKVAPKVRQTSLLRPPGRRPVDGWYSYGTHANRFPRPELSSQDAAHIRRPGGVVLAFFTETHRSLGTQRFLVPLGHHRAMATEALKQAEIPEGAAYVTAWLDPRSFFPSYFMLMEDYAPEA